MCTDEQHSEKMAALQKATSLLERIANKRSKLPIDQTIELSDTQGWQVDYKDYGHIFLWNPGSAVNINFGEYGTGLIQSQVWINLGIKTGIKIFTSGQATTIPLILRFTNEVIP